MKKFLLAFAAIATCMTVAAQNPFNSDDNHRYFGVRLGLDLTCPSKVSSSFNHTSISTDLLKTGAGFNAGVIYNMPIFMNLYFEPGVNLYYHTYKFNKDLIDEAFEEDYTGASIREFGISVPRVVGYHFDFEPIKLRVFTGPVFNVGIKGNVHVSDKSGSIEMEGSDGIYEEGGINRSNISWRFGAGIDYKQFNFSIYGDPELTNACHNEKNSNFKFHRNVVSFTLGYNF